MATDRLAVEMHALIGLEPRPIKLVTQTDVLGLLGKLNLYLEKGSECRWVDGRLDVLQAVVGVTSDVLNMLGQEESVAALKARYNYPF